MKRKFVENRRIIDLLFILELRVRFRVARTSTNELPHLRATIIESTGWQYKQSQMLSHSLNDEMKAKYR